MKFANSISLIVILIGMALTLILICNLENHQKDILTISAIIGSVASFFGLIVAIIQIISIKKISVAISETVQKTRNKIIRTFSISDISKNIELIKHIRTHNSTKRVSGNMY